MTGGKTNHVRIVFLIVFVARRVDGDAMSARSQFTRGGFDTNRDATARRAISVAEERDIERSLGIRHSLIIGEDQVLEVACCFYNNEPSALATVSLFPRRARFAVTQGGSGCRSGKVFWCRCCAKFCLFRFVTFLYLIILLTVQ